jgi:hypothetical protein
MVTDFSRSSRVNIAILTNQAVTGVTLAQAAFFNNQGLPTSRPALGITIDDTQFYSVHALSGGGNDGRQLINNINWVAGWRNWAAMGDWNRVPADLDIGNGRFRYTSNQATYPGSGRELDYMVSNERLAGYGGYTHGLGSDHFAVGFHHQVQVQGWLRPGSRRGPGDLLNLHRQQDNQGRGRAVPGPYPGLRWPPHHLLAVTTAWAGWDRGRSAVWRRPLRPQHESSPAHGEPSPPPPHWR